MIRLLPEWHPQLGTLISWPPANSDWHETLDQVRNYYLNFITLVLKYDAVYVLCGNEQDEQAIRSALSNRVEPDHLQRLTFFNVPINDTWIRDYGPISAESDQGIEYHNFQFNAWGGKFKFDDDNRANSVLAQYPPFNSMTWVSHDLILEGGAIEVNGFGTLMINRDCVLHANRAPLTQSEFETFFQQQFSINEFIWLENLHLIGDDTDGHIDNFARFCDADTIVYLSNDVKDTDQSSNLHVLREQLEQHNQKRKQGFRLVPIPLPSPVYSEEGERLPASYINFLITNHCVIVPQFSVVQDQQAMSVFQSLFPSRVVLGLDCRALLRQGGGIHCATMQLGKA